MKMMMFHYKSKTLGKRLQGEFRFNWIEVQKDTPMRSTNIYRMPAMPVALCQALEVRVVSFRETQFSSHPQGTQKCVNEFVTSWK